MMGSSQRPTRTTLASPAVQVAWVMPPEVPLETAKWRHMGSRDRPRYRPSRRLRSGPVVVLVLVSLVTAAAAGCATVPSGGAPKRLVGQSGQQQAFVQPLPPPGPQATWNPRQVVLGFIQASANFNLDPAAAQQYLVPALRKKWPPKYTGITVVDAASLNVVSIPSKLTGGGNKQATVHAEGQPVASLASTGQYSYQLGTATYSFGLQESRAGIWQISELPTGDPLLLTQSAFE